MLYLQTVRRLLPCLLLALPLSLCGGACATNSPAAPPRGPSPASPDPEEVAAIDAVLLRLYDSFCFDAGDEPDWATMRSLFARGAGFVAPIRPGRPAHATDADTFVREFRAWIESAPEGDRGLHERIARRRIDVFDTIAHAWVVFEGFEPGPDASAKTRGLDSIQLIRTDGKWLVASFTTQYASDDTPVPARFER